MFLFAPIVGTRSFLELRAKAYYILSFTYTLFFLSPSFLFQCAQGVNWQERRTPKTSLKSLITYCKRTQSLLYSFFHLHSSFFLPLFFFKVVKASMANTKDKVSMANTKDKTKPNYLL